MSTDPPRVRLRPLDLADADVIAGWSRDEEFCRAAEWSIGPLQHHLDHQRRLIAEPPPDLIRLGALHEDELVGTVDLHGTEPRRRELGYVIGRRDLWGRGLGLAAARAGLSYGFGELGLDEIWAEALDANRASVRILEKLGMTETGWGTEGTYLGRPTRYRQFSIRRV